MLKDMLRLTKKTYIYVKPYMRRNIISFLLTQVSTVLTMLVPLTLKFLIDNILGTGEWHLLPGFACIVAAIIIGSQAAEFYGSLIYDKFTGIVCMGARNGLFYRLLKKRISFYDKTSDGDLLSRLMQDATKMHELLSYFLNVFLSNIVRIVVIFTVLLLLNVQLAVVSMVTVPVFLILNKCVTGKFKASAGRYRKCEAEMTNKYVNSFKNIRLIKNFSCENAEYKKVEVIVENTRKILYKTETLGNAMMSTMGVTTSLNQLLVLVIGGFEIAKGGFTIGGLVAFNSYLAYMYAPFTAITSGYAELNRAIAGLDRFFEYDNEKDEENLDEGEVQDNIEGSLSLRHVSFGYDGKEQVLNDLNLDIRAKEKLLIRGKSGIGKSTMVSLLKRFYSVPDGRIFIDGKDINQINLRTLRSNLFYLSQDNLFFEGSIRENFQMVSPDISDEAIYEALDKACIVELVQQEEGLDSILSKGGSTLSGGQKQRLGLARVFVQQGKILVFDEPFTGIDRPTVERIWGNLKHFLKDRTVIFIDHYFEDPEYFDRVMTLRDGQLPPSFPSFTQRGN